MVINSNKIDIRMIRREDLIHNKKIIINLLEDNLSINFPQLKDLEKYAVNFYDDMLRFNKDDSAILIGAFENKSILGFIWAYERKILGETRIHIGHIVVSAQTRSGGIGSKLLNFIEIYATERNVKKIDLITTFSNEKTMKFYKKNGFSTVRVQLEKELGDLSDN